MFMQIISIEVKKEFIGKFTTQTLGLAEQSMKEEGVIRFDIHQSIDDLSTAFDTGAVYAVSWDDTTVRGRYVDTTLKHSIEPESGSASTDVGSTGVQWSFRQLDADDATFTVDSHQLLEAERVTA